MYMPALQSWPVWHNKGQGKVFLSFSLGEVSSTKSILWGIRESCLENAAPGTRIMSNERERGSCREHLSLSAQVFMPARGRVSQQPGCPHSPKPTSLPSLSLPCGGHFFMFKMVWFCLLVDTSSGALRLLLAPLWDLYWWGSGTTWDARNLTQASCVQGRCPPAIWVFNLWSQPWVKWDSLTTGTVYHLSFVAVTDYCELGDEWDADAASCCFAG